MKKIKIQIMAVVLIVTLVIKVVCMPLSVYANEYTDALYETFMDLVVMVGGFSFSVQSFSKGDFDSALRNFYLSIDKYNSGLGFDEWLAKNFSQTNGQIELSEELMKFLQDFIEAYALEHPDEVEKVDYRLFQTSNYEELFDNFIDIKNAFANTIDVPEELNSMENFRTMLKSQSTYSEFPHLMLGMVFSSLIESQKNEQGNINQNFTIFQNYEKALTDSTKTPCFIGTWNADGTYRVGVYIYDSQTKSLTVDRSSTSIQQYHFEYSYEGVVGYTLTGIYKNLFGASGNAYINMTDGYWNGWGNLPDATLNPGLREKYMADFSGTVVKLPILGTPDETIFRLFATEQDALRYFETCADSGLNFDPSQVYTGGSITINNNGDVIINNNPSGSDDEPGGNSSGILGVLEDIRDWVKKIYNQVVIGNVINAVDALANVLDTLKNYMDEAMEDMAAIGELGELLETKFPFSLPQDILLIVTLFEAEPVAPVWEIPFRADFGGPTGMKIDEKFTVDFTDFQEAVDVLKWFLSLVWIFGLAMLTPKVLEVGGIGDSKGD